MELFGYANTKADFAQLGLDMAVAELGNKIMRSVKTNMTQHFCRLVPDH